ncbi:MAG TPA: signal peptidase II [bacterium]|nr:signal peptidase II [bacterium]
MILIGVSLLVLALDQATKFLVLHSLTLNVPVPLVFDFICLTYTQNPGTAFGLLGNLNPVWRGPFFISITAVAGIIVYAYQRLIPEGKILSRVALGLIWGGAMGNFADRLFYGKVVDFIDMGYQQYRWYVFNLADTCISLGILLLIYEFLFLEPKPKAKTP